MAVCLYPRSSIEYINHKYGHYHHIGPDDNHPVVHSPTGLSLPDVLIKTIRTFSVPSKESISDELPQLHPPLSYQDEYPLFFGDVFQDIPNGKGPYDEVVNYTYHGSDDNLDNPFTTRFGPLVDLFSIINSHQGLKLPTEVSNIVPPPNNETRDQFYSRAAIAVQD